MLLLQKTWKGKLADKDIEFVLERLENIDDKQALQLSTQPLKSPIIVWIFTFLSLGCFGIDRFYKGDILLGILKLLLTLVALFSIEKILGDMDNEFAVLLLYLPLIITFCELITIFSSTRKDNLIKILKALASVNVNK